MIDYSLFSFERFHRQYETPVFEFVLERLGRNWHVSGRGPADTDDTVAERLLDPSEPLQNAAAEITVEVFVQLYRLCSRENLLDGETTVTDKERDELRDRLYKSAAWLCDGP
ncbi:MAG: hypothetical protein V4671_20185 [Armatimonadota bacterium]